MISRNEHHLFNPAAWKEHAACAGYPTSWWYPENGQSATSGSYTATAKAICNRVCPVRDECLDAALARNEDGIWGGTSLKERRALRRERKVTRILICQTCRNTFAKPATTDKVALYCSDACRKRASIIRQVEARRINGRRS